MSTSGLSVGRRRRPEVDRRVLSVVQEVRHQDHELSQGGPVLHRTRRPGIRRPRLPALGPRLQRPVEGDPFREESGEHGLREGLHPRFRDRPDQDSGRHGHLFILGHRLR